MVCVDVQIFDRIAGQLYRFDLECKRCKAESLKARYKQPHWSNSATVISYVPEYLCNIVRVKRERDHDLRR